MILENAMDLESINVFFFSTNSIGIILLFLVRLILLICVLVGVALFNFIGTKFLGYVHSQIFLVCVPPLT